MTDDEPKRTRRVPGWADIPAMTPPSPEQLEFMGLSVMVTVLERMAPAERRRCLAYLTARYADAAPREGGD